MSGGRWGLRVVKWGTQMLNSKLELALAFAFYFRKQSIDAIHYLYDRANVTILKNYSQLLSHTSVTPEKKKNQAQVDLEMILPQTPPKATRHWNLFWNKLPIKVTKQRGRGDQSFKYGKWHIWFMEDLAKTRWNGGTLPVRGWPDATPSVITCWKMWWQRHPGQREAEEESRVV